MQKHQCGTQKSKRVYLAVSQTSAVWFLNVNNWKHLPSNSNIDSLGLMETWLSHSSPEAAIVMADYNVYGKDRGHGNGGGGGRGGSLVR